MSKLKATPGPWEAKRWGSRYYRIVEAHQGLSLARTTPDWPLQIEIANARLIAAAPELYHYLELALTVLDRANIAWGGEPAARAVLAKASGESAQ
jgi:hypothetical protein